MSADDGSLVAINAGRLDRDMGNSQDLRPQFLADHVLIAATRQCACRQSSDEINTVGEPTRRDHRCVVDGPRLDDQQCLGRVAGIDRPHSRQNKIQIVRVQLLARASDVAIWTTRSAGNAVSAVSSRSVSFASS